MSAIPEVRAHNERLTGELVEEWMRGRTIPSRANEWRDQLLQYLEGHGLAVLPIGARELTYLESLRSRIRVLEHQVVVLEEQRDRAQEETAVTRECLDERHAKAVDVATWTRELLCEIVYRRRGHWDPEHPNRALGLRELDLDYVAASCAPDFGEQDDKAMRALAAKEIDQAIRIGMLEEPEDIEKRDDDLDDVQELLWRPGNRGSALELVRRLVATSERLQSELAASEGARSVALGDGRELLSHLRTSMPDLFETAPSKPWGIGAVRFTMMADEARELRRVVEAVSRGPLGIDDTDELRPIASVSVIDLLKARLTTEQITIDRHAQQHPGEYHVAGEAKTSLLRDLIARLGGGET